MSVRDVHASDEASLPIRDAVVHAAQSAHVSRIHAPPDSAGAGWQLPPYDARVFRPRASRYCVCVFAIDEGARLHAQLERMRPYAAVSDVVLADGGSTDGSSDDEALAPYGLRAVVVNRGARGLSVQMRMALAWALLEGYEGVIVMDGNNKDDPAAIPAFMQALDDGWDHVQGSRYMPGGRSVNMPWKRHLGVRLLHAPLISRAAGVRYTDTTNGFRAYSRRLLADPRVAPFRDVFRQYELHYYLAIRAARLGYRVRELSVTREYPRGKVPTKISGFRGELLVLRTLVAACLHRYDPERHAGSAR